MEFNSVTTAKISLMETQIKSRRVKSKVDYANTKLENGFEQICSGIR